MGHYLGVESVPISKLLVDEGNQVGLQYFLVETAVHYACKSGYRGGSTLANPCPGINLKIYTGIYNSRVLVTLLLQGCVLVDNLCIDDNAIMFAYRVRMLWSALKLSSHSLFSTASANRAF